MDRQIVYPGAVPFETDLLNTNKFAMIGLAKLASAVLGSGTCLVGLQCEPTSPASFQVKIGAGEIYCLQLIDETAYSSLAADHSDTILKQGLTRGTALELLPPTLPGMSINYLIQVGYEDADTGESVLPYYNAADPSITFSGPQNNGNLQPGVRAGKCMVSLKASSAASTGTQVTPAPDEGYVSAWLVTVSSDMKTIETSDIHVVPEAPFIPSCGVFASIQKGSSTFAYDTGSANAYYACYQPPLPPRADGMRLTFKAREANSGKSTFSVRSGEVHPLLCQKHKDLEGGEIISGGLVHVEWDGSAMAWLLCSNVGGALPIPNALNAGHAINLGQAREIFLPLAGGELTGELRAKGIHTKALYVGDALYDECGDIYAVHWKNQTDEEIHRAGHSADKRGWLTKWLKLEFGKIREQFLPLRGGTIEGDLTVKGKIKSDKVLEIGNPKAKGCQAKIDADGNVFGQQWNGSLSEWLKRFEIQCEANYSSHWWFRNTFTGLLIQGGEVLRKDTVTDVYFPVSYTTSALTVLVSLTSTDGKSINNYTVSHKDALGFKITAGRGEVAFSWIAIGR